MYLPEIGCHFCSFPDMTLLLKSFLDNGGVADWMGDTFCDDINNNEKCNYDDGDCCGFSMNYNFCIDCTCKCKLNLIREPC